MPTMRCHSAQRCYQLTQPVPLRTPPPAGAQNSLYYKPLTAQADGGEGAFAGSAGGTAGSVRRRLRPPSFPDSRNLPRARPPTQRRNTDRRDCRSITFTTTRRFAGAREVPVIRKEPHARAACTRESHAARCTVPHWLHVVVSVLPPALRALRAQGAAIRYALLSESHIRSELCTLQQRHSRLRWSSF